jgi:hypothetical protein
MEITSLWYSSKHTKFINSFWNSLIHSFIHSSLKLFLMSWSDSKLVYFSIVSSWWNVSPSLKFILRLCHFLWKDSILFIYFFSCSHEWLVFFNNLSLEAPFHTNRNHLLQLQLQLQLEQQQQTTQLKNPQKDNFEIQCFKQQRQINIKIDTCLSSNFSTRKKRQTVKETECVYVCELKLGMTAIEVLFDYVSKWISCHPSHTCWGLSLIGLPTAPTSTQTNF